MNINLKSAKLVVQTFPQIWYNDRSHNMCVVSGLISSPADRLEAAQQWCCAQMYHPPIHCGWYVLCFKSRVIRFCGLATYLFIQIYTFRPIELKFSEVLEKPLLHASL